MLFFGRRRPFERLSTSFRWLEQKPFRTAREPSYTAGYDGARIRSDAAEGQRVCLGNPCGRPAVLRLHPRGGSGAGSRPTGIPLPVSIFRHVNDENFYSFLLSTRGNFRVDILFNNHPMRLIEWTRAPEPDPEQAQAGAAPRLLRVIGHGSRFSFHVDDEWVAEVEDEMLPEGGIGFAAQNFDGSGRDVFRLRRFLVDVRPLPVEREHTRWWYYAPVSPAARLRLAETLYGMDAFRPAAVQLRKALKDRAGTAREHFLLAECYMRLSMYEDALGEVDHVLAAEPAHPQARLEKPNLLYLSQRLLEARDSLRQGMDDGSIAHGPGVWNLLGNAEYGLGNWEKAVRGVSARPLTCSRRCPCLRRTPRARSSRRAGRERPSRCISAPLGSCSPKRPLTSSRW